MDLENRIKKIENALSIINQKITKLEKDIFTLLNRHKPNIDNNITTLVIAIKKLQKQVNQLENKK